MQWRSYQASQAFCEATDSIYFLISLSLTSCIAFPILPGMTKNLLLTCMFYLLNLVCALMVLASPSVAGENAPENAQRDTEEEYLLKVNTPAARRSPSPMTVHRSASTIRTFEMTRPVAKTNAMNRFAISGISARAAKAEKWCSQPVCQR